MMQLFSAKNRLSSALSAAHLLLIACFGCELVAHPAKGETPNIVLIMCDDLGFSDIGCYGGEIDTPNLDRLAAKGMRFTQFYNNAKCTTTRASILTGLYPRPEGELLQQNMVTLGEAIGAAGYKTVLSGKWHLGYGETTHPSNRGFDEFYGLLDGACNFFDPSIRDPEYKGSRSRVFARNFERIHDFPEGFYTTDAFTDHAIETITKFHAEDEPFFLHVCYNAPHYPLHAKPKDIAKYRGSYRMGWDALRAERFARQRGMGLIDSSWSLSEGESRAYSWETADQDFEDLRMSVYAAMVDSMDQSIGRLLDTLERLGVSDNTVVFFLSDNGGCSEEPGGRDPAVRRPGPKDDYVALGPAWGWAQNAPFKRYKSWTQEGGVCTPMIAYWPGRIEGGQICREPGHIIDFMPTLLEIAGGDYPSTYSDFEILPVEGRSLLPLLKGQPRDPHPHLFWEWARSSAVRGGKWKAVWDKLVRRWELYDLESDRTETRDLAAEYPETLASLVDAYENWAASTGNRIPQPAAQD